jgi:signal transduction histidine kinase
MFKSARVKLTIFYLAVILVISLVLTVGTRLVTEATYHHSDVQNQGRIRLMIQDQVGLPLPNGGLNHIENGQESHFDRVLTEYTIYVNLAALVVGGLISYWYAGRTLRPIEEAHAAQARFASDASHELRTPLTAMQTENEVFLRQHTFSEKEARDQLKSNLEEIQRLENLATSLLALSNYEEGHPLKVETIKTGDIINEAVSSIERSNSAAAKRIVTKFQSTSLTGNMESLVQVLSIFLDNALKYSPKGSKVHLSGVKDGEYYKFMVQDKGPGIDAEDMPNIFNRLYRGDKARSKTVQGNGLGLSLAKEIAIANKAGLSVANVKGGGACFTLTLENK